VADFELVFGRSRVAQVWEEDADFPTTFGRYELLPQARQDPELERVMAYHDFSVRVWPLYEREELDHPDLEEEQRYQDLIDSLAWALVRANGDRISILIPVFCTGGRLNWRFS
jgi:hypothetical protein